MTCYSNILVALCLILAILLSATDAKQHGFRGMSSSNTLTRRHLQDQRMGGGMGGGMGDKEGKKEGGMGGMGDKEGMEKKEGGMGGGMGMKNDDEEEEDAAEIEDGSDTTDLVLPADDASDPVVEPVDDASGPVEPIDGGNATDPVDPTDGDTATDPVEATDGGNVTDPVEAMDGGNDGNATALTDGSDAAAEVNATIDEVPPIETTDEIQFDEADVTKEEDDGDETEDAAAAAKYDDLDVVCNPNPCDQGSCSRLSTPEGGDEASCSCYPGYVGDLCDMTDPCLEDPCQHEGSCHSMGRNGDYSCHCTKHFTGDNCEYVDPCFPNPCQNDGICVVWLDVVQNGVPTVDCICADGFTGLYCDIAVST